MEPTYHRSLRGRTGRRHPNGRLRGPAIIPVVFVHGTRTSSAIWAAQLAAVARAGHAAVAVDLPGHGSRTDERFTLGGALRTIDEAIAGFSVPPLLVGLSLGGYASLAYAASHPRPLSGLVLSGCSTELRGKPLHAYRALSLRVARMLRPRTHTWHVVADMLSALRGHSPLADLARLDVPAWLVNGRWDALRLDERRFLAAHPRLRHVVVGGAGHDVNSHAPDAFNRILLGVLRELEVPAHALAV